MAVVSLDDLAMLERLRRRRAAAEFTRLTIQAAHEVGGPEPSEQEIVEAVKHTREALYRTWQDLAALPDRETQDGERGRERSHED